MAAHRPANAPSRAPLGQAAPAAASGTPATAASLARSGSRLDPAGAWMRAPAGAARRASATEGYLNDTETVPPETMRDSVDPSFNLPPAQQPAP